MWSSKDSFVRSEMFTRRTATVIISAPEASCALTITAGEAYLPVPTMSRDAKILPAIVKVSTLSTADEVYDLDLVAVADDLVAEGGAFSARRC